jgi:hypothetical protein
MQEMGQALVQVSNNVIHVPVQNAVEVVTTMTTNAATDANFLWRDIKIFTGAAETPLYNFQLEVFPNDPTDTLNRGGKTHTLKFWLAGQGVSVPIMILWAGSASVSEFVLDFLPPTLYVNSDFGMSMILKTALRADIVNGHPYDVPA